MPGPHIPPALPYQPGRRQSDYHYQQYTPQPHTPLPHNPYANWHPHYHGYPPAPQYQQQWYPPYQQPQYPVMPRQYQHPHSPLVVSSQPHVQPAPMSHPPVHTPPVTQARTPQPEPTSAPALPTPAGNFQALLSPETPAASMHTPTLPSAPSSGPPATLPQPSTLRWPFQPPVSFGEHKSATLALTASQLPWLSVPDKPLPPRTRRRRRRAGGATDAAAPVEFPNREDSQTPSVERGQQESETSTLAAPSEVDTPATSQAPSEADSTHPTTPSSAQPAAPAPRQTSQGHTRSATRPVVPLVPVKPVAPKKAEAQSVAATIPASPTVERRTSKDTTTEAPAPSPEGDAAATEAAATSGSAASDTTPTASLSPPKPAPPKSWADLVRTKSASAAGAPSSAAVGGPIVNGFNATNSGSLGDVLRSYTVDTDNKLPFLEPRGLVNTGNMCYMNSILQVLVFCIPFYDFLDQLGKRAAHSFKSENPLLDAMIMFMREFPVITSAESVEKLRLRLNSTDLEQFGEPFIPEFVYDVIKRTPRFSSMRRGHQQDAEEFLGFLLAELHEECARVIRSATSGETTKPTSPNQERAATADGWLEVGPKQKAAVTRSSGTIDVETPITKIFGGKLRSELRVPGLKNSVTLEPYQPLQLDIGAPNVHNITDALKALTHSETLQGDFNSPRGPNVSAVKQVFIETLPPVLILHLKRFQYDNTGGTQKIWKRVGYPLELELPKEVFPPSKRGSLAVRGGPPKYRLIGVIYHHGKNASGGHYTVDARRQEGREWIRMDDTIIRRVRSEDVAEGGSEEDPKVLAKALEQHKRDQSAGRNLFDAVGMNGDEENADDEAPWSQVNGSSGAQGAGKKWSSTANGTATPSSAGKQTPTARERGGLKDNKVAYILFYQQIKN